MNAAPPGRDSVDVAFARALERDRRCDATERAKRRAVEQRCDYGAFHQLVLGANLSPLERSSWIGDTTTTTRDSRDVDRRTRATPATVAGDARGRVNEALTARAPETMDEFSRAWRRLRGEDEETKCAYLFAIPIEAFEVVFKVRARVVRFGSRRRRPTDDFRVRARRAQVELALDVLIDFVRLITSRIARDARAVERAAHILCALTACGRFESHARLAGADVARDALRALRRAAPSATVHRAIERWDACCA